MNKLAHVENMAIVAGFVWLAASGHWIMALLLLSIVNYPSSKQCNA
jgi:hypothetical protein